MNEQKFDVLAIDLKTLLVRFMARDKTELEADAIVKMAVMRRGVDREFFSEVPAGTYAEGETWNGKEKS